MQFQVSTALTVLDWHALSLDHFAREGTDHFIQGDQYLATIESDETGGLGRESLQEGDVLGVY